MKQALAGIGIFIVVVAVLVGGYLGGWWLREDRVDRTAQIDERTFARQTALQEEILTLHREVRNINVQLDTASDEQRPTLEAQRRAIMDRLCDAHARTTGTVKIPDQVENLIQGECY